MFIFLKDSNILKTFQDKSSKFSQSDLSTFQIYNTSILYNVNFTKLKHLRLLTLFTLLVC